MRPRWCCPGAIERGLLELALNREAVVAAHHQALRQGLLEDADYIRPGQDAVLWGTDFSCNTGPMLSPADFAEICLPNIRERVRSVHRRGLKVVKHACGNNRLLLDYFVEAGYDCYQSIQQSAGMDLGELSARYGDRLALWGGVPVEHLIAGTMAGGAAGCAGGVRAGPAAPGRVHPRHQPLGGGGNSL